MTINTKKLHLAMLNAGFDSAKHLSEVSGVSVNTISRLNNGGSAKVSTVRALAATLNVDPAELVEKG